MIAISKPSIGTAEKKAVIDVLHSGVLAQGVVVEEFEKKFANYIGVKHAIATSSGTTALHLALLAHNIQTGDEVITTAFSFIASSNAILYCGARPVFVDTDDCFNLDSEQIEKRINKKTRAILVVHLFGHPADMERINAIAKKYKLAVIEDACQAHGAAIKGKKVGNFGTGCFSFYPTKNMTTGEGGMITTNNAILAEKIRLLRNHGMKKRYVHTTIGYNFRMTNIAAAIGLEQLKKLDTFNETRNFNAQFLSQHIRASGIVLPAVRSGAKHVFHQYTIRITNASRYTRENVAKILFEHGIQSAIYYPMPIYKQKAYAFLGRAKRLPRTEQYAKEVLSLPVHPGVNERQLRKIVLALNQI